MNVDRLMERLESTLTPARYGGVTVTDCIHLDPEEVLFLLAMLGRGREKVLDRVLGA